MGYMEVADIWIYNVITLLMDYTFIDSNATLISILDMDYTFTDSNTNEFTESNT